MSDTGKKWYVLRAIGGKEKKVKEYIENEIARGGLQDFVTQVLIPTEKVYQIRNGKKISKERSFYPGYVLVEANLVGEIAHVLRNIPNVIGFLGDTKGGDPVPLRQYEVNRMNLLIQEKN
jgi:transcriptional antiterminator NusG